jgi:hypothetical protein
MPLIDLVTNLKSLKYGSDRINGGSSNQPYEVNPIPEGFSLGATLNSPDFLLREGSLNPIYSLVDVSRLTKFFTDPKSIAGLNFIAKQTLLERQNPKIPGIQRVYSPTNTINQAGVLSIGYHLNKQGTDPYTTSYIDGGTYGYFNFAQRSNNEDSDRGGMGRMSLLYRIKKLDPNAIDKAFGRNQWSIDTENFQNLLSYTGGPNTGGLLGKTNIRIWDSLNFSPYALNVTEPKTTFNLKQIGNQTSNRENTNLINVIDFRKKLVNADNTLKENSSLSFSDYTKFNRERAVNNGGYGTSQTYFKRPSIINRTLNPNLSVSSDNAELGVAGEDIIDFNFRLLKNDSVINPDGTTSNNTTIDFRAYIEDFQDSYNASWEPFKYVGRADTFYKYSNLTRQFSITFVVPALSRADMVGNYQKLNALVWAVSPDYSNIGYMRGNMVELIMGDYFRGVPAIINSLTFSPIMEMGFDINRYSSQDELENPNAIEGQKINRENSRLFTGQLPKGIRVQSQITILHNFVPQRGKQFIGWTEGNPNDDRYIINELEEPGEKVRTDGSAAKNYVANRPDINDMRGKLDAPSQQ